MSRLNPCFDIWSHPEHLSDVRGKTEEQPSASSLRGASCSKAPQPVTGRAGAHARRGCGAARGRATGRRRAAWLSALQVVKRKGATALTCLGRLPKLQPLPLALTSLLHAPCHLSCSRLLCPSVPPHSSTSTSPAPSITTAAASASIATCPYTSHPRHLQAGLQAHRSLLRHCVLVPLLPRRSQGAGPSDWRHATQAGSACGAGGGVRCVWTPPASLSDLRSVRHHLRKLLLPNLQFFRRRPFEGALPLHWLRYMQV